MTLDLWDPAAARDPMADAGYFIAGPYRIVLHTTEGSTYGGARSAYKTNGASPHFTVSYEGARFRHWQHIAINRSAKALEHRSGTVHTNRLSAVQIEIVGFADAIKAAKYGGIYVANFPAGYLEGIADLIEWIRRQVSVAPVAALFKAYPASYGERNGVRMSAADWLTFNGICGHQHVPHQSHGDPGALNVAALLPAPKANVHTQTVPIPVHDFEELSVKQTMMIIGKLDENGRGWSDWDPGLGRDPNIVGLVLLGPSPADDGYWEGQEKVQLSAQPRGGKVRVVVRGGTPGDTVTAFIAVA